MPYKDPQKRKEYHKQYHKKWRLKNLDSINFTNEVPPQITDIIDVNLEELISNLE